MSAIIKEIPEGEYVCDIVEMQSVTDHKNRKVVSWVLRIVNGPYADALLQKRYYVVNAKVAEHLKKELIQVGVDAKNAQDFEAKKTLAYGKRIRIMATTNDGFQCLYVKEVIGMGETVKPPSEIVGW